MREYGKNRYHNMSEEKKQRLAKTVICGSLKHTGLKP